MAEFPYPEYRNLWPGSALSKDRSAVTDGTYRVTSEQIGDGLRLTVNEDIPGGTSLLSSISSFNPTIQPGMHWWVATFRNPGTTPFPISFGSRWFSATGSQVATSSIPITYLAPGETRTVAVGRDAAENMVSTGFWLYYAGASTNRPNAGDVIEILDGITLVQSETVPPFPFNGDGAKPVETLKRRNLVKFPVGPAVTGRTGWTVSPGGEAFTFIPDDGGFPALEVADSAGGENAYVDPNERLSPEVGRWVAFGVDTKALDPFRAENMRLRISSYSGASTASGPSSVPSSTDGYVRGVSCAQVTARSESGYLRTLIWPSYGSDGGPAGGFRFRNAVLAVADTQSAAEAAVASYFDGDTPASGNLSYRWAPDGTSLEVETIQPPTGRTYVWDGEPYKSTSTLWVGDSAHATGVMDVGIATEARLGIVADVYSRSREKIQLELARVDSQLIAGERVELDAAAMTASPVVWHWRQVTGPTVELEPHEASLDFIAPDVDEDTTVRIAVYAASEDGRNRSDWHYFDLTIKPPMARFRASGALEFEPVSPKYVGYDRGKREIWNDVIPPPGFSPNARHETEIIDLGILPDDVQFTTGGPPEVAAAGGIYVDLETGDIYRNFGAGYNETDDTTAAPRTNAWWVNPATGDILEWIED